MIILSKATLLRFSRLRIINASFASIRLSLAISYLFIYAKSANRSLLQARL